MTLHIRKLPYIEPELIFNQVANTYGTIFLDSSQTHSYYGRYSFIAINPTKIISPDNTPDLEKELKPFTCTRQETDTELTPFTGGLAGYMSYDYNRHFEPILKSPITSTPDYWFGLYNQVFAFDHEQQICYLYVTDLNHKTNSNCDVLLDQLEYIYNKVQHLSANTVPQNPPQSPLIINSNFTKEQYAKQVESAINHILDGDIFEVNLSQQFSCTLPNNYDDVLLYNNLRRLNKAPFASFLNLGELKVLSASPERFLSVQNRKIEVRPIKGTIKCDLDHELDIHLQKKLQSSVKDRAENIMIVDLMRNDLSKICTTNSVQVTKLCGLESFTNLHHLVSVIEGELRPDVNVFDILRATFPGGSVTGAPKIRAMQIIHELEHETPRGVYCGAIGYFGFNGHIDLAMAIRTIVINKNTLSFNVGGAVTLQSDPMSEYEETMLKGRKLHDAISLMQNQK